MTYFWLQTKFWQNFWDIFSCQMLHIVDSKLIGYHAYPNVEKNRCYNLVKNCTFSVEFWKSQSWQH